MIPWDKKCEFGHADGMLRFINEDTVLISGFYEQADYKLKNEQAPLEYVKENIKNLILNRRKIEFLKQIENNVYSEGIRKNNFKIYN